MVGQAPVSVVFGKGSGIDSVKWGMRKLGVQFNEEEAMRVVAAIKEFSLQRKRLLTDEEFRGVVSATLPGKPSVPARPRIDRRKVQISRSLVSRKIGIGL